MNNLTRLTFHKITQSHKYTSIILGTEYKKFAIYTEPRVGQIIQLYKAEYQRERPLTYELLNGVFLGFNIKVLQAVITDIADTTYFASLFLSQESNGKKQIVELDARPSDCITLALIHNIPILCKNEVLDKAVAIELL
jgi:uncharacterized protein